MKFSQVELVALIASIASAQTLNIPTRVGDIISLPAPSVLTGSFDGGNAEYDRGHACDSDEDTGSDNAVFVLEDGASLSNVIIGSDALEGVHCLGSCTLTNVWFRDVCEDAISILGTGDALIVGGGAQEAIDKVVQHNGAGTVTIRDYTVVNAGKLYRSCGDCTNNQAKSPRKVIVENVRAFGLKSDLVGINSNFGDSATISGSCGITNKVCQEYKGVNKGNGAKSEKVSTTDSCTGAQALLEALPACSADEELPTPEVPSTTASAEEPTATPEPTSTADEPVITAEPTSAVETPEPTVVAPITEEPSTSVAPSTFVTKTSSTSAASEETGSSGSVALYGQCGGNGYTGSTECAAGTCTEQNIWYSQCV